MKQIWTDKQIEILKANYANIKTKELTAMIGDKSSNQIRWKAKTFELKKNVTRSKADMTWLEDFNNPEACYWWGFITADGCINEKQLIIAVHEKDEEHLKKFCVKTGSNISRSTRKNDWHEEPYTMVRTSLNDKYTLKKIRERLKIVYKKTYNPFDISEFCQPESLIYFMAGLIDGDGNVSVDMDKSIVSIRIKIHGNWLKCLKLLSEKLKQFYGIESVAKITKDGWACLRITKMRHVSIFYELIKNKVPYMERKWEKLNFLFSHCNQSKDKRLNDCRLDSVSNLT